MFDKIVKNQHIKIEDKFENFSLSFVGGVSVFKLSLPLGPMLTKTKKKIVNISIFKIKKKTRSFVAAIEKKIQEKFENFRLRFVAGVAF